MTEDGRSRNTKAENAVIEFFRQTFRRHSGSEYSELLTRGMRGDGGVNKKYPWAYIRLFALFTVLFAIFLLIIRFTLNELFMPTVTVIGSIGFSLTILLFIYELYPKKDLSFMSACLAMLLGGAIANILTQILFSIFVTTNEWLFAVFAGLFEELPKAIATIMIIVISRKNSPLAGFVLGAAVGCGFSIVEDMGYIFMRSNALPMMNLNTIIEVSVSRGVTALCTHILWTAAIGWAYCHFSRHLANIAFYLITIISCGLHICWDLPLSLFFTTFVYIGCAAVAVVECLLILHFERKKVFNALPELTEKEAVSPPLFKDDGEQSLDKQDPVYWRHWGHFTIALGMFLMAVIAIIYCSIPFRETYATETFSSPESFVEYMQNGMEFDVTENRHYNSHDTENDIRYEENDKLVRVIQREIKDEVIYNYEYTVSYDAVSGNNYFFPVSVSITINNEYGVPTVYYKEDVYNNGKLYASFFRLNDNVT
ncbi:MAG: PrsW family intramembrane metalloprotease, partial [Clostridia bacterium]|nr:PrsW family intramembrane metalloprotease [Clostridia bacterium]